MNETSHSACRLLGVKLDTTRTANSEMEGAGNIPHSHVLQSVDAAMIAHFHEALMAEAPWVSGNESPGG